VAVSRTALRTSLRRSALDLSYAAVTAAGLAYRLLRRGHTCSSPVETILVIRLDLLGDVLFSRQALQSLRLGYPHARIVLLTLPYTAPLAAAYPEVDDVIEVDTNLIRRPRNLLSPHVWAGYYRALCNLRRLRPDIAVSLSGRMASLWAFLSGAPCTVGYRREAFPFMLTHPVAGGRYERREHEVKYVRRLAEAAGGLPVDVPLAVPVSAGARARVRHMLAGEGIGENDAVVIVHAGSINGSAKRWPTPYWSAFCDRLQRDTDARVVLVGSGSDSALASEVRRGVVEPIVDLVGRTSVEDLLAVIERADLVATGDSGPLHLAVALHRPLLAVYGPTDPRVHGPFMPSAPVLVERRDLTCSPCYTMAASAECPLGDPICMRLVSVEAMVSGALQLLAAK
jgi:lipopolysaccharide heptosyltransferase II